jgi:dimeric dUTPase (all-alpha-NTP-PPase superfamily)
LIEKYQGVKQMNLSKLFELQRQLDEHIMNEHPELRGKDNLQWKVLALQVELGELANEWRGFKKWSHDQEPRTKVKIPCRWCSGEGEGYFCGNEYTGQKEQCIYCEGTGVERVKNPLLEEYVDCLHFVLSIGLDIEVSDEDIEIALEIKENQTSQSTFDQFVLVMHWANSMHDDNYYHELLASFTVLGEMLGFTWEQIEEAYMKKNKKNHQRQDEGY